MELIPQNGMQMDKSKFLEKQKKFLKGNTTKFQKIEQIPLKWNIKIKYEKLFKFNKVNYHF